MATQMLDTSLPEDPMLSRERAIRYRALSNKQFELIVFTTEQCNFRCTYCYEDFSIGHMREPVVSGICSLITQKAPTLDKLHVSYFGGEPLMNMRAIRRISGTAQELSARTGMEFTSGATTNAFLLNEALLTELIGLNCTGYQISLDGWHEHHDKTRVQRNGKGSFERIWENLLAAKNTSLDFNYLLRVHLLPSNIDSVFELVENINRDLNDDRFEIMFKKVGFWGGANENHPAVFRNGSLTLNDAYDQLRTMAARVSNAGVEESGGSSGAAATEGADVPYVCYASRANSIAVRANGRVNKCTVALTNPANDIGSILPDGRLDIDSNKLAPWLGGISSLDDAYLGCPASKVLHAPPVT